MMELLDQADASSIESFGKKLLNSTLRKQKGVSAIPQELLELIPGGRTRGSFGKLVEEYYYDIHPGSESRPDFEKAGVELKTTPIRKIKSGPYSAKERLVLNMINYLKEAEVGFDTSSFYTKNNLIMLLGYLYEKGIPLGDMEVKVAQLLDFESLSELDRKIIREDWEKINKKIREGKAHELSEGDTLYLGACTKSANAQVTRKQFGTDIPAKPRAYSFKSGYMTKLLREMLAKHKEETLADKINVASDLTFEEQVLAKLSKFYGKTNQEIEEELGSHGNRKAKDYVPTLVRKMMGLSGKDIPEFDAAEITMKTIQVNSNHKMRESLSFPAFKITKLLEQQWDADESEGENIADFQKYVERRFLFVIFQYDKSPKEAGKKFLKAFFWSMPYQDRENVRQMWEETIIRINENDHHLPGSKENDVAHIRPHGRDRNDIDYFPDSSTITKQGFWLNKAYIEKVIRANL